MINKPKHCIIVFFLLWLPIHSCTTREKKQNENLVFKVDSINVNHVVEKRNGCRFSTLDFYVSLVNNTNKAKQLEFIKRKNPCERNFTESDLRWVQKDIKKPLVIKTSDPSASIIVPANQTEQIVLESTFKVEGISLSQILAVYHDWFSTGKIIYYGNDTTVFKKSKDFKTTLYLDDTLINKSDSVRMNKTLSKPNTDFKIDSIIGNPPTKEPEL